MDWTDAQVIAYFLAAMLQRAPSRRLVLATLGAAAIAPPLGAQTRELVFVSSQLRMLEELRAMENLVLQRFDRPVLFDVEFGEDLGARIDREATTGPTIDVIGGLYGEMWSLTRAGVLDDVADLTARLAPAGITEAFTALSRMDTLERAFVPWMHTSYVLVAHRRALNFLPSGADPMALTYEQLITWGATLASRTGSYRVGFPAGPTGLLPRFLQGYFYPSYTGGMVTGFRSKEAVAGWRDLIRLWDTVNAESEFYNAMAQPLLDGDIWVAFDHVARVIDALKARPDEFIALPAPAGPKGRGYLSVLAGLGIPRLAPDRAGAARLIEHLLSAPIQAELAHTFGFFPVRDLPADTQTHPGVQLAATAVARMRNAPDAILAVLPNGLGNNSRAFSRIYADAFQAIIMGAQPIEQVLDHEAARLHELLDRAMAPCWAPDPVSMGPCWVL